MAPASSMPRIRLEVTVWELPPDDQRLKGSAQPARPTSPSPNHYASRVIGYVSPSIHSLLLSVTKRKSPTEGGGLRR